MAGLPANSYQRGIGGGRQAHKSCIEKNNGASSIQKMRLRQMRNPKIKWLNENRPG